MNRYDFMKNFLKIKAEVVMIDMISDKLLALAVHVLLRDALRTHNWPIWCQNFHDLMKILITF